MANDSRPMDYGEAVWRTAEIRMQFDDMRARLNAMPPFARYFALQSVIAQTEKDPTIVPEVKEALLRTYRSWGRM